MVNDVVKQLKQQLTALETRKATLFGQAADVVAIEGALNSKNEWFRSRAASPVRLLAKMEDQETSGLLLLSFEASNYSGMMRFVLPEFESGQAWVRSIFGTIQGQLKLENKESGKQRFYFSWKK